MNTGEKMLTRTGIDRFFAADGGEKFLLPWVKYFPVPETQD